MQELVRGMRINIIGNIFRFSRSAFFVLATLLYGTELFGVYTVTWATSELLIRYGTLGLENGLLFELAHFRQNGEERKLYQKIASSLKACLFASSVGAIGVAFYTYAYVDTPTLQRSLFILIPLIVPYNVSLLLIQATMGLKRMEYNTFIRSMCEPAIMVIGLLIFRNSPWHAEGIILAQALALLVASCLSIWAFSRLFSWRILFRTCRRRGRYFVVLRSSLPIYVIELIDTTLYRLDIFWVTALVGTGDASAMKLVGLYGFTKQIARVITQTKNAFGAIFIPVSSESYLRQARSELWQQIRYVTDKLLFLNTAFVMLLAVFGKELIALVGKETIFFQNSTYLMLLCGQYIYSSFAMLVFFLIAQHQARVLLAGSLLILTASSLAGPWVSEHYGLLGAAGTITVAYGGIIALAVILILRNFGSGFLDIRNVRIVLAGLACAALIHFLKDELPGPLFSQLSVSALIGLSIYFLLTIRRATWRHIYNKFFGRQA